MIQSYIHGGGAVPIKTKRVFLKENTVYEGFAVCYSFDAKGVTAENESVASTAAFGTTYSKWCDARRLLVEIPDYENGIHFAGVVAKESHGVVGPNWITIHTPGSICNIYSLASAGAGITATDALNSSNTTVAGARMLTYSIACNSTAKTSISSYNGTFVWAGYAGEGSVRPLQAVTAYHGGDTAWDSKQLVMAELMMGPPSGGVQLVAFGSSISSAVVTTDTDHNWAKVLTPIGVSVITIGGAAPTTTAYAYISWLNGTYFGQRKGFFVPVVAAGTAPALAGPATNTFLMGASTAAAVRPTGVTSAIAFGSVARDFIELTWTGGQWYVTALCSSASTVPVCG